MEKIKILHLIPSLAGGGAERQLVDVVSNTSRESFSQTVCVLQNADFFGPELRNRGYEVIELGLTKKHPWLSAARKVEALVRQLSPDIIHSWLYDADVVSRLVKLWTPDVELITSLQAPGYEPEAIKVAGWSPTRVGGLRLIDSTLARLAKPHFVACSRFVARSAERRLAVDPAKISVIYNSVDPLTIQARNGEALDLRNELAIPGDAFVFLSVGRLDAGKGFDSLLEAFASVSAEMPDAFLIIVGSGPLADNLRDKSESLKIKDKVLLTGRRKDIGTCLEMADAFVFPTRFEGFGIALIEAMSKGLACIATDLEVLREVVDEGRSGLLIPLGSTADWASAMTKVYDDAGLRSRLGVEARKKAENSFYSKVLMPQWEDLYRRVAKGRQGVG